MRHRSKAGGRQAPGEFPDLAALIWLVPPVLRVLKRHIMAQDGAGFTVAAVYDR